MNGLDVSSESGQDTVLFSINSKFSTNWVTSLDFAGYSTYTPDFIVEDMVYLTLLATNNLFCIVMLEIEDGKINQFKWFNFFSIGSLRQIIYIAVSNHNANNKNDISTFI